MKLLTLASLIFLASHAHAGSWTYSCQSTDGEVNFTRDELVLIQKESDGSIGQIVTKKFNDDINGSFEEGAVFRFKDDFVENKPSDVLVTFDKFLSESTVEESTECPPGDSGSHGPGHSTTTYKIKGSVQHFDVKKAKSYTCHETFAWSGRCHFDGEENK